MNTFDRVCRAIGIGIGGSVASWLMTLGIAFIVDDAKHQRASVGVHNATGSEGAWIILPIVLSGVSILIGAISSMSS